MRKSGECGIIAVSLSIAAAVIAAPTGVNAVRRFKLLPAVAEFVQTGAEI